MTRRGLRVTSLSLAAVTAATWAALEAPYLNWQAIAPPVDVRPLLIRHDAKGDGRFAAPRSGHRQHRGVDLAAELGSPVRTIRSGMVTRVGLHHGLGRFVEVAHRRDLHSLYAHLNEVDVRVGERVRQGERIGTVGKTGNARHPWIAPHVHLEVVRDGEPIDPQTLGLVMVSPQTTPADGTMQANDENDGAMELSDASGGD